MTGTFGSLNIAKTGLQYQQIAIDVADNNVSNVNTTGYVRESAQAAEMGGPSTATMWSTYPGYGEGVQSEGVQRLSDVLLSARQRSEHGTQSYLEAQQTSMSRFETAIGEPGDDGVSAALSDFSSSLQDLANSPDATSAARTAVLSKAATLTAAIQAQARNLSDEASEQATGATTDVAQVNAVAQDLASLNHSIFVGTQSGNDVNDLEDQRDQDALQLAQLAGATTTVQADGRYAVSIGGVSLVSGDTASTLQVATTTTGTGTDGSTLTFQMQDPSGATSPVSVTSGDLGGVAVLLNSSLPQYYQGLNKVAYDLASAVNAQQESGYDASGTQATSEPLFSAGGTSPDASTTYDPSTDYAGTIAVAITDPSKIAASLVAPTTAGTGNLDAQNADALSTAAASVSSDYQTLVTNLGVQVNALNTQTTNQQTLTTQVDNEWQQSAGVSIDEETINLMAAQRAYEASAKVLSVMDDVLNTLINNTVAS